MTSTDVADDVLSLGVRELGAKLRAREVTSVQLTQAYLARLETVGAKLCAVAALLPERALAEARAADAALDAGRARGPLHGIPYGVKDLFAARGAPTTWGAPSFAGRVIDDDATVVTKLRDAGAVLVAKLAMIELAGAGGYASPAASLQGATRCPHDVARWSGGSSSGPGAAVAASLVGFAVGSETLGSILSPSAFCGVSGLRPTYGRVSRAGAMACSWTMDKVGPMCRSAVDCGLVFAALAGPDVRDASALPTPFTWRAPSSKGAQAAKARSLAGKRIAVIAPDASEGDPAVAQAFTAAVDVLRSLGATIAAAALPDLPYRSVAITLYTAEAATSFRTLIESGDVDRLVDPMQRAGLRASAGLLALDYLDAARVRGVMQRELARFFTGFDVVVAPTRTSLAPKIDADLMASRAGTLAKSGDSADVMAAGNVAGLPAISVPCGFVDRLPAGMQIVAAAGRDATCLDVAVAYQAHTAWHTRRPVAT